MCHNFVFTLESNKIHSLSICLSVHPCQVCLPPIYLLAFFPCLIFVLVFLYLLPNMCGQIWWIFATLATFVGLFSTLQNFEPTWSPYLANFHCCKWPNIEKITSSHLVALKSTLNPVAFTLNSQFYFSLLFSCSLKASKHFFRCLTTLFSFFLLYSLSLLFLSV